MLVGTKVYLRGLEETDLELTHQWVNDQEIIDTVGVRAPISRKQQQEWFEGLTRDRSKVVFAICLNESDQHVGNVSLRDIDTLHRHALFSIFLDERTARGGGIGSEATILTLKHAFGLLNLHRVYLKTTAENAAAIAMYRKLGFTQEGRLRDHEFKNGFYVDKVLFGMLASEFASGSVATHASE